MSISPTPKPKKRSYDLSHNLFFEDPEIAMTQKDYYESRKVEKVIVALHTKKSES